MRPDTVSGDAEPLVERVTPPFVDAHVAVTYRSDAPELSVGRENVTREDRPLGTAGVVADT